MLAWFSLTAETILLNGAADTKENHFQTLWPGEKKSLWHFVQGSTAMLLEPEALAFSRLPLCWKLEPLVGNNHF